MAYGLGEKFNEICLKNFVDLKFTLIFVAKTKPAMINQAKIKVLDIIVLARYV